jgi:glycosyltransferase involved in cell wall biosynthesis
LPDARFLLFVGRLAPNKRVPVLIQAMAQLRDLVPPVHAVIVGDTGDVYRTEAERCLQQAQDLGIAEHVHFLGKLSEDELIAAYRSASLFVMPSAHEGFCLPVIEAMACGLPVLAARAAALPESAGNAGLFFRLHDPADLARQIRRALDVEKPQTQAAAQPARRRIAIVTPHYGEDVLGGAERSLQLMAETLAGAGYTVEVFATDSGAHSSSKGADDSLLARRAQTTIHRFPVEPQDKDKLAAAVTALRQRAAIPESAVRDYLEQTTFSRALLDTVIARQNEFAAILAGPHSNGLVWELCRAVPEKVLLVPCFHDEPLARQAKVQDAFRDLGGILYHSPEERQLAENDWNIHTSNAHTVGAFISKQAHSSSPSLAPPIPSLALPDRYLLYSGRYCREKNLPLLLKWAQRYRQENPKRFAFVFTGRGDVQIPNEPGFVDLGFVPEFTRTEVLAGATALLQLSTNEALSLVALEAWIEGVPVIAHQECSVMRGHIQRGEGGRCVGSYAEFRAALDELWSKPEVWREIGRRGRQYVEKHYTSQSAFLASLESAITELQKPLLERLRQCGLERARDFALERWREAFLALVDSVVQAERKAKVEALAVIPPRHDPALILTRRNRRIPVRLKNTGTAPLLPSGPAAKAVWTAVFSVDGESITTPVSTPLPRLVLPGEIVPARLRINLPQRTGEYRLSFHFGSPNENPKEIHSYEVLVPCRLRRRNKATFHAQFEEDLLPALIDEAEQIQQLPAGYVDVCEGRLADWKRKIKRKLLHQFQISYVDVLSRQQSAFNRQVLAIMQELAERLGTLEQRFAQIEQRLDEAVLQDRQDLVENREVLA